ncbi:MAG: RNA polymerase sigma factor (sigma-70 family) [Pseudohongiellaceae bacterium]|jgi:RNA polymerase sigma factor (sigma-70 family)
MTQESSPLSVESLLAESTWVRSLARSLLFDQSQVDDVVQQTWVVALQRQPRRTVGARPWLAGILRNVVRRQVRDRKRQQRHETLYERRQENRGSDVHGPAAAADLVEQAELFRALVNGVLDLDEPFRTTVILRYFKGLDPREIAVELGVPGATVRTRLHRALEVLRGRMDGQWGQDRRAWSVALIPLIMRWDGATIAASATTAGAAVGTAKISMGVLTMTMKLKLVGAAVVLALAGAGVWLGSGDNETPAGLTERPGGTEVSRTADVEAARHGAAEGSESLAALVGSDTERPQKLQVSPALDLKEDPVGAVVFGAVRDELGDPFIQTRSYAPAVRFAGPSGLSRKCLVVGGSFAIAGLASGSWVMTLDAPGFLPFSMALELEQGDSMRHDVSLSKALILPVRIETPVGASVQDALDKQFESYWDSMRFTVVATKSALTTNLPPTTSRDYLAFGLGSYETNQTFPFETPTKMPAGTDGMLQLDVPLPVWASLLARNVVVSTQEVLPGAEEILFVISEQAAIGTLGEVSLTVVDMDDRSPVTAATVELSDSQSSGVPTKVGAAGQVRFTAQRPGLLVLLVRAPGKETLRRVVTIEPGELVDLGEVSLSGARTISGRVVDSEGRPAVSTFQLLPVDRFDRDAAPNRRFSWQSDANGEFTVKSAGRERFVFAVNGREQAVIPQIVDARYGDVSDVELVLAPATRVAMNAPWSADVPLNVHLFSANGAPVSTLKNCWGGQERTLFLAPGSYEYRVGERGDVRRIQVGAKAMTLTLKP